jgi:hypothetical protein
VRGLRSDLDGRDRSVTIGEAIEALELGAGRRLPSCWLRRAPSPRTEAHRAPRMRSMIRVTTSTRVIAFVQAIARSLRNTP